MKKALVSTLILALASITGTAADRIWFDGGITNGFPNAETLRGGAWTWDSEDTEATYADGLVDFDADYASPISFNVSSPFSLKSGSVSSVVEMDPGIMTTKTAMTNVPPCKTGFQVRAEEGSTNYYCIAAVEGERQWVRLDGATYSKGFIRLEITIRMAEDGTGAATFTVTPRGGTPTTLTYLGSEDVPILIDDNRSRGIDFSGSGRIAIMDGRKDVLKGIPISPLLLHQR